MSDEQNQQGENSPGENAPSENAQGENAQGENAPWRTRIKELGRRAFELEEMERLGFWPPDDATRERTENIRRELREVQEALAPLRQQQRALEKTIGQSSDMESLLAEVRARRIERVKAERAARKIRRAEERKIKAEADQKWRAQTLPHLGREVSRGLKYEGGDNQRLQVLALPLLQSAQDVADALEITTARLAWLTYHRGASAVDHYVHFSIPKKSGGTRSISSPKAQLRAAQSWLLENVLQPIPIHDAAVAFRSGINIADNARRHAGRAIIVRIDLKDFFPSITFGRVKNAFVGLGYNEGVASLFALLCTEAPRVALRVDGHVHHVALSERFLPQGACTSPTLTNVLCRHLDARLTGAAQKLGFTYSRYADDLVFSSDDEQANIVGLQNLAKLIIEQEKLQINSEKTAIMRPHRRQSVTGLVVNAAQNAPEARVSRRDLRRFRAFLHRYETLGREALSDEIGQDALSYARGYLSFIHMTNAAQAAKIRDAHRWLHPVDAA